jgi:hypothetical protein
MILKILGDRRHPYGVGEKIVPIGLEMREEHIVKDAYSMAIYLHIIKPGVLYTMALPLI